MNAMNSPLGLLSLRRKEMISIAERRGKTTEKRDLEELHVKLRDTIVVQSRPARNHMVLKVP